MPNAGRGVYALKHVVASVVLKMVTAPRINSAMFNAACAWTERTVHSSVRGVTIKHPVLVRCAAWASAGTRRATAVSIRVKTLTIALAARAAQMVCVSRSTTWAANGTSDRNRQVPAKPSSTWVHRVRRLRRVIVLKAVGLRVIAAQKVMRGECVRKCVD